MPEAAMSRYFTLFVLVASLGTSLGAHKITWKVSPPSCHKVAQYKTVYAKTLSDCQKACEQESKCVMAEFSKTHCKLSSSKKNHYIPCMRKSSLIEKVKTNILPKMPSTAGNSTTAVTASPVIVGPTPDWKKHDENCMELESFYNEFKVRDEAECKLKCYVDENCLVVEYRPDHFICKLSNTWRYQPVKRCSNWGVIFHKDLKKCPSQGDICQENAVCVNTRVAYECRCERGYVEVAGRCSEEVNECLESSHVCDRNAFCVDTIESYQCRCKLGFNKGAGNKCIRDPHIKQIPGSGKNAADDCAKNARPCPKHSVCVGELGGKFECKCVRGYHYNKITKRCEDIDECGTFSKSKLGCTSKLKCFNTIGSYYCACDQGYKKIDKKCEDVDECSQGLCGENMHCQNFPGSYSCSCREGYREEMYWCNDIDECHGKNKVVCEGNQKCVNSLGSYKCSCDPSGYNKPADCQETASSKSGGGYLQNQTAVSLTGTSYMRFVTPAIWKSNTSFSIFLTIRPDTSNGIIMYAEKFGHENFLGLSLKNNFLQLSFNLGHGPEKLQMDIPLKVDTWHGIEVVFSMDKVGLSFDDHLRKYQRSKYTRVLDVDDIFHIGGVPSSLDVAPNLAKNMQINSGFHGCIGFLRIDKVDYDLSYPGRHVKKQENINPCEDVNDVDECAIKSKYNVEGFCGPNSICLNTIGKYLCSCKQGYNYEDYEIRLCEDVDECKTGEADCGKNAKCENTFGSYRCICTSGYYNYTTTFCEVAKHFPLRNGWFVQMSKFLTSTCKKKVSKQISLKDCKERCMNDETCAMIKYRSIRAKCTLCQSTKLRVPSLGKGFIRNYDFYMKAIKIFHRTKKRPPIPKTTQAPPDVSSGPRKDLIILRGLCVHTYSYSPSHVLTAPECTRRCEKEPGCVMAKFSSAASLCWVSRSRKMAPRSNGCDGKFRNIYDYYVKPLDECDGRERLCLEHSNCVNEKGHRYCQCNGGFEKYGDVCEDTNECELYDDLCGEHAHCLNIPGTYECLCNLGYVGDGFVCVHKSKQRAKSFGLGLTSSS